MPRHLESTIKLILEDNIKNHFKRKLSLYLSLYFALLEFPFILCWTWLHEPVSGDGVKLCYYSSRWSAVPNFCSQATQKSYRFYTNHMQHTVAFTGSELWASFNFSYSTASANLLFNFKNISRASNFAGFLPVYDNIFGSFFPGLIQPPERVFQD